MSVISYLPHALSKVLIAPFPSGLGFSTSKPGASESDNDSEAFPHASRQYHPRLLLQVSASPTDKSAA
ncbi:hypothetical protein [Plesiomonas shigelloides]|uniref:hypothetical protein n=1 Tax=Plesiomonas shigelloides TaxID=703 RepID=UPI001261AC54|nr:hypothetical protein [Plesiomonas shigelloides]KAB7654430.1 hypothetical protein GBN14_12875 [Plesiomonas shigelloides]